MTPSEIADWLDKREWPAFAMDLAVDIQAAATIRAQSEKLKIATEALEAIDSEPHRDPQAIATEALARIKEVG